MGIEQIPPIPTLFFRCQRLWTLRERQLAVSATSSGTSLPRVEMVSRLRSFPASLPTAGLICGREERTDLAYLLLRAGALKVTNPGAMTQTFVWEAYGGEYPLMRYTKAVKNRDAACDDKLFQ